MTFEDEKRLVYLFGHLVGSFNTEDAHHAASAELAEDEMEAMEMTEYEKKIVRALAEEVAGNYEYTGAADDIERRIKAGQL